MSLLKKKLEKTIDEAQRLYDEIRAETVKIEYNSEEDIKQEPSSSNQVKFEDTGQTNQVSPQSREKPARTHWEDKKNANSTKNIVKNFGRAMMTFGMSKLAEPYLENILQQEEVQLKDFQNYLHQRKERMDGISSLRGLLLIEKNDEKYTTSMKKIFKHVCEIFIKYYSVNWIFHSKLGDKMAHCKARFKILRRIRKPEHFTYFKVPVWTNHNARSEEL